MRRLAIVWIFLSGALAFAALDFSMVLWFGPSIRREAVWSDVAVILVGAAISFFRGIGGKNE